MATKGRDRRDLGYYCHSVSSNPTTGFDNQFDGYASRSAEYSAELPIEPFRADQLIVDNLTTEDQKARRKLVWLANYHNRFIVDLREQYDMEDPRGEFYAELEVAPAEMFDSLMIEGTWTSVSARLAELASREP